MKQARYLYPHDYMSTPSAHVFGSRLYIYPAHDLDTGESFMNHEGEHFQMRDFHVLTLDDVENGEATDCGLALDLNDIPWARGQMWDNDVVEHGGHYYMVFCAKDMNGRFRLGMAVADRPEGPFKAQPSPIYGSYSNDPCLFKDDDGQVYCYFGGLWGGQLQRYAENMTLGEEYLPEGEAQALPSRVARMDDSLLQFAEAPEAVYIINEHGEPMKANDPHRFFEASWMHKYQGRYYFSYSTGDSHLLCYAVGDNPYGPFMFRDVLLQPVVGWTTHACICEYRGRWYLFHHDSAPSGGKTWLRSLKVMEISYDAKGDIVV